MFPERSIARTRNLWKPRLRPEYVFGERHGNQGRASSWQMNRDPGSVEVKRKVARRLLVDRGGAAVMRLFGATVSGGGGGGSLGAGGHPGPVGGEPTRSKLTQTKSDRRKLSVHVRPSALVASQFSHRAR